MPTTTLLIYMAADNSLDTAAQKDLESIRKASIYSDMDIVVQLDRWEFVDAKEGFRYHFKQGVESLVKRLGEVNSGHPDTLRAFIEESAEAYPADKLMVIIWSHGSGVDDRDIYHPSRELFFVEETEIEEIAIAHDDASEEFIDNIELQKALDVSVSIDLLGFDACLMGMFEIAYQLRHQAGVMVASQHIEPPSGWPYETIVEQLGQERDEIGVAETIVRLYRDHYERSDDHVTQSAYRLEQVTVVAEAINGFAKVLRESVSDKKVLRYALEQTQSFSQRDYIDLKHFVSVVAERIEGDMLQSKISELLTALEQFIIKSQALGSQVEQAHGVSIYFPSQKRPFKETFAMYEKLDFSHDYPEWITLLRWYYS